MLLLDVLSTIPFYQTNQTISKHTGINDIHMDHRRIQEGDMFIAIRGYTVDGHTFISGAIANGATVIVAEEVMPVPEDVYLITVADTTRALASVSAAFYQFPTTYFSLIGVTGTNGKTTTTYILESIFQEHQEKTGLIGTMQAKIGQDILPVQNTTPDALELQRTFNQMREKEVETAVMEVSSHGLDIGRVNGCDFDIAIFTNLSQDHLDYHNDMDDYLRAKTLLFTGLGTAYHEKPKYAVLNADDQHSKTIAKSTAQPIVTYGIYEKADIYAERIHQGIKGITFDLVTPFDRVTLETSFMGQFNIYNILAAASAALLREVPLATIKRAIEGIQGVAGRFEQVEAGQDYAVIVDYAHTPDSLQNVLETVKEFAERKIYVVVGTGGDRDKTKRPQMAAVATEFADCAIFTSDNPRTEQPMAILNDMTDGVPAANYEVIENRKKAIETAISYATTGDVILIAGKGHEAYQEIHGVKHDFDDRVIAKETMLQKGK